MYFNADQLPDGINLTGFDICIVGAGAAGIPMAHRLIGSSKNVLLVTSGSSTDVGSPDPVKESIYGGVVGDFMTKVDPAFLTRSRLRMYGGTTNHFGYWARPLEEADLRPRPGYRDAYWPLDITELNRYYPDANDTGGFGPFNYDDIDFWAKALFGTPFPPLPGDSLQNAIFHGQYDYTIHDFQLQYGADLKAATNVTVLFNANVLNISSTAGKDHVTGFSCATISGGKPGKRFRIESATYVLAQGGIEPVRLLKLSGNLGDNAKGQLGRGFMVHPLITNAATVRFPGPVDVAIRNFFRDQQVRISPPTEENAEHTPVSAPTYYMDNLATYYVFNAWGVLEPTPQIMNSAKIGNFRIILGFNSYGDFATINFNWEQVPNENSTITLDATQTDPVFGQPVVRLDWNLLEQEKRTIISGLNLCQNYLKSRYANAQFNIITNLQGGPEDWTFAPYNPNDGTALRTGDHHMGALRMSETGADGIVNSDLRLHTVDNLYIAGCGVFPTSGYANPTLTLVALALRLADHLNAKLS